MVRTVRYSTFILNMPFLNFKLTCLIKCLLLYWPKIHRIFVHFLLFWHKVSFFYFLRLKLSLLDVKIRKKRKKGKRFGHMWGPSSVATHTERNYGIGMLKLWYILLINIIILCFKGRCYTSAGKPGLFFGNELQRIY